MGARRADKTVATVRTGTNRVKRPYRRCTYAIVKCTTEERCSSADPLGPGVPWSRALAGADVCGCAAGRDQEMADLTRSDRIPKYSRCAVLICNHMPTKLGSKPAAWRILGSVASWIAAKMARPVIHTDAGGVPLSGVTRPQAQAAHRHVGPRRVLPQQYSVSADFPRCLHW
jgi:hypothetical protein